MKKKSIAVIGTVGLPAKYGGFETLADHLVENLSDQYDFTVFCSSKKYPKDQQIKTYKGAKLRYINLDANGIQSILYDAISIFKALKNNDILLILGVAGAWILPFVKLFTNKKIIISIDGIEWKRDKWSTLAKLYLFWAESIAVKFSHFDISDNEAIQDYTAYRYNSLSKIIEYGADHTQFVKPIVDDRTKYSFLNQKYAVKVCRIEPENNVHIILEAFASIKNQLLVIVGNWNNSAYGKNLKETYQNTENIILLDPIYNQREIDLIRSNAYLYVHGHSAGGTNPSLVEAMYLALPVIAFNVSYNCKTTENKALFFKNKEELINILKNQTPFELKNIAQNLKTVANQRYKWSIIAKKYQNIFEEVFETQTQKSLTLQYKRLDVQVLNELNLMHLRNNNYFYENSQN